MTRSGRSAVETVAERLRQTVDRMPVEALGERLRRARERVPPVESVGARLRDAAERVRAEMPARRRGPGAGALVLAALVGAAAGAALMFVFDPERGRRRRALIRDQVGNVARRTGEAVDDRSRQVMSRARGLVIDLRSRLPGVPAGGSGDEGEGGSPSSEPASESNRP